MAYYEYIEGEVVRDGEPIPGVRCDLYDSDENIVATEVSHTYKPSETEDQVQTIFSPGRYYFENLAPGVYTVHLNGMGFDGRNSTSDRRVFRVVAAGQDAVIIDPSPVSLLVPTDADGSNPDLNDAEVTASVLEGATATTSEWTINASGSTGVAISAGGPYGNVFTVTGLTADTGYIDIWAIKSGSSTLTKRVNVSKSRQGLPGSSGSSIVYLGAFASPPAGAVVNNTYKNTGDGIVYIYTTGSTWVPMTYDGSDGADGADGSDGTDGLSVYVTYHDNPIENQPSAPTGDGTTNGWHTNPTDAAIWMSQKVASGSTAGTWGDPILLRGLDAGSKNFVEDFSTGADWTTNWISSGGTGTVSLEQVTDSERGGRVLQVVGYRYLVLKKLLPFDPNVLYAIRFRVRQPTAGTNPTTYLGFIGVGADGVTLVNESGDNSIFSQHYISRNTDMTGGTTWLENVGYLSGVAASGDTVPHPSVDDPAVAQQSVRYMRPVIIANYSDGTGTLEVDYLEVSIVEDTDSTEIRDKRLREKKVLRVQDDDSITTADDVEHPPLNRVRQGQDPLDNTKSIRNQSITIAGTGEIVGIGTVGEKVANDSLVKANVTATGLAATDVGAADTNLSNANPTNAKTNLSLNNVENKDSSTIRGEITKANVTATGLDIIDVEDSTQVKDAAYSAPVSIGDGEVFPFDDETLETESGVAPLSGFVATRRPGEGLNGQDAVAVEEATTNLLDDPQDMSVWTARTRCAVADAPSISPPSLLPNVTVQEIVEDGTAADNHFARENPTLATDTDYVAYAILKASGRDWAALLAYTYAGTAPMCYFDLSSGVQGTANANVDDSGIYDLGDGWYLCWIGFNSSSGAGTPYFRVYVAEADEDVTFDGNSSSSLYHAHSQIEAKTFPTSPVVGSRAAGELPYPPTVVPSGAWIWYGYADYRAGVSTPHFFWSADSYDDLSLRVSGGGAITLRRDGSDVAVSGYGYAKGGHKVAVAFNGTTYFLFVDGVLVDSGAGSAYTPTTAFALGYRYDGTQQQWNGLLSMVGFESIADGLLEADIKARVATVYNSTGPLVQPKYGSKKARLRAGDVSDNRGLDSTGDFTGTVDGENATTLKTNASEGKTAHTALDSGEDLVGGKLRNQEITKANVTATGLAATDVGAADTNLSNANVTNAKTNLSLNNVENKDSATIRGEITKTNVTATGLAATDVGAADTDLSNTNPTNAKTNLSLNNVENKDSSTIRSEITKANVTATGLAAADVGAADNALSNVTPATGRTALSVPSDTEAQSYADTAEAAAKAAAEAAVKTERGFDRRFVNLLLDPSFELSDSPWTLTGSASFQTASPPSGTDGLRYLKLTENGTTGDTAVSRAFYVTPGHPIAWSAMVKRGGSEPPLLTAKLTFYTSGGSPVSPTSVFYFWNEAYSFAAAWVRYTGPDITVPATAAYAVLTLAISTTMSADTWFELDDIECGVYAVNIDSDGHITGPDGNALDLDALPDSSTWLRVRYFVSLAAYGAAESSLPDNTLCFVADTSGGGIRFKISGGRLAADGTTVASSTTPKEFAV